MIDDHSRVAFTELHQDERAETVTGFVERALAFYRTLGIDPRRIQTDNHYSYTKNRSLRELLAAEQISHHTIKPPAMRDNDVRLVITGNGVASEEVRGKIESDRTEMLGVVDDYRSLEAELQQPRGRTERNCRTSLRRKTLHAVGVRRALGHRSARDDRSCGSRTSGLPNAGECGGFIVDPPIGGLESVV